jgi:hypothetical protein
MSGYLAGKVWMSDLSSNLKPIAACLANFANDEGDGVYPSNAYLQWLLGWGESTVRQAMASLKKSGFLVAIENINGGRGKIPVYRVDIETLPARPTWREFKRGQNLDPLPERGQNPALKGPESSRCNKEDLKENLKIFSLSPESESENVPSKRTKEKQSDLRHLPFRQKLEKCWAYLNPEKGQYRWSPADAGQLATFLKDWPKLTLGEFHQWLMNYCDSECNIKSSRPHEFLPRLHQYADNPLDTFRRPLKEARA